MPRREKRGQGSIEYLLILSAVIGVVGITAYFLTGGTPSAIINGTAEIEGDNVVFTPSDTMTPAEIPAGEWKWAAYRGSAEEARSSFMSKVLKAGEEVSLGKSGYTPERGDEIKIFYKDTWHDAATIIS